MTVWIIVGIAALIIIALGVYAGRLLFLLQAQNRRQQHTRDKRIQSISESIQTIAFAMEQQQCEPSEGVIRICNLLLAMPIVPQPDYKSDYPAVFELYERIKHFPTLDARNSLSRKERKKQDKEREQIESELSSEVQKEVTKLRTFKTI